LKSYLAEASSIDLLEVVFKAVIELDGVEAANHLVSDELRRTIRIATRHRRHHAIARSSNALPVFARDSRCA